jgi:putative endopeptidase
LPFFVLSVLPDAHNSTWYAKYISQSGLGLMDKDYYISDSKVETIDRYHNFLTKMFGFIGLNAPAQAATQVISFEKMLAQVTLSPVDAQDPIATYNKKSMADLKSQVSRIDWGVYFETLQVDTEAPFIVENMNYLKSVSDLVEKTSISVIQNYLRAQVLISSASLLSEKFVEENFNFFGKTYLGVHKMQDLSKRLLDLVTYSQSDYMSKLYVEQYFPDSAKVRAAEMIQYLIDEYKIRIQMSNWMTQDTKLKALDKISTLNLKIGYPEKWIDYGPLKYKIDRSHPLVQNMRALNLFKMRRTLNKANKRVDKHDWSISPTEINAYYDSTRNEIVIPAAILAPPMFFAPTQQAPYGDPVANFASIGVIIGHEISHAFDESGRKFNSKGNMENWWTAKDEAEFEKRSQKLAVQFNRHQYAGEYLNGNLTLNENIADLGGIQVAYSALGKFINKHPEAKTSSWKQKFFVSYAQMCRQHVSEQLQKKLATSESHSPSIWRVNGMLGNIPEFYEAFPVQKGDAMYIDPKDRAQIW